MNGFRAGKYAFKAAGVVVELAILLIIAGPIAGAVTPQLGPQHYGIGIDLSAVQTQLNQIFSSSNVSGTHELSVPAFNNWPLAGEAGLTVSLMEGNKTLYQSQPASVHLAPYHTGAVNVTLDFSPSLVSQMQGQHLGIGGTMTVSEDNWWSISVNLAG